MELGYVFTAIMRRWWLVVACIALGGVGGGYLADNDEGARYESQAVLIVLPPSSQTGATSSGDPDRYVLGQLSVLESRSFVERVAAQIGDGITVEEVVRSIAVANEPATDIVTVTAVSPDSDRAQLIAQTFVEQYIFDLIERAQATGAGSLEEIDAQLVELEARLAAVNQRLADAGAAATAAAAAAATDGAIVTPVDPTFVDPAAASEQSLLILQFEELLGRQSELKQAAQLKVNAEIVQNAAIPILPVADSSQLKVIAGLLAGGAMGVIFALIWARWSTRILGERDIEEILGVPVVSALGHHRALSRLGPQLLVNPPSSAAAAIDQLCVRAEAAGSVGAPLRIAVVGTGRSAGSTTTAMLIAHRFAPQGSTVTLVDADIRDPALTDLFADPRDGGIPALLAESSVATERHRQASSRATSRRPIYSATPHSDIRLLGVGTSANTTGLRRHAVPGLLTAVTREGPVVIVDGGPLLEAASTVELCETVDAVVLVVPIRRQRVDELRAVAGQLTTGAKVLPFITHPSKRQRRPVRRPTVQLDAPELPPLPASPDAHPSATHR